MSSAAVLPFVATLRRLMRDSSASSRARCDVCGTALSGEHHHTVDINTRRVLCACEICSTLEGRYRRVPTRYVRLPETAVSTAEWNALEVPVGLAFFFHNSQLDRVVACYPGPAGAAESLLSLDAWPVLANCDPTLRSLLPDVEALLVRRVGDHYDAFIVPIDACYELAGRIRGTWTGFAGGDAGHDAIDAFFGTVLRKSSAAPDGGTRRSPREGAK